MIYDELHASTHTSIKRWRICSERKTRAGIATEDTGLILHAADAETAVRRARQLIPYLPRNLVAIGDES